MPATAFRFTRRWSRVINLSDGADDKDAGRIATAIDRKVVQTVDARLVKHASSGGVLSC